MASKSSKLLDVKKHFNDYADFHKTKGNKLTHVFGIPMIVLAIVGLLDHVPLFGGQPIAGLPIHMSLGFVVWVLAAAFYLALHFTLGLTMMATTMTLYLIGAQLSIGMNLFFFVLGWAIQYWGHYKFEKKKPAFYKNLIHLLIGPAFIQNYFLRIC